MVLKQLNALANISSGHRGKEKIHSFGQQQPNTVLEQENRHESNRQTLCFYGAMSNWGRYHKQEICLMSSGVTAVRWNE